MILPPVRQPEIVKLRFAKIYSSPPSKAVVKTVAVAALVLVEYLEEGRAGRTETMTTVTTAACQ